jgi:hypothetical protein
MHTFFCELFGNKFFRGKGPGVENIADHGTIGPRKFFMLAERKKGRKKKVKRKKRRERKRRGERNKIRKEKEYKERESNSTNK